MRILAMAMALSAPMMTLQALMVLVALVALHEMALHFGWPRLPPRHCLEGEIALTALEPFEMDYGQSALA